MHRVWPFLFAAFAVMLAVPAAGAIAMTINATPAEPRIGDTVTLSGTVTGINTIAVYLYVTGPGLDTGGVTLDNLNIPTGRGLFTTAPVNMANGSWSYAWDTSAIIGSLRSGIYHVHVVASPVERMRFVEGESATADIRFLPPLPAESETPLDPVLPLAACGIVLVLLSGARVKKE